MIVYSGESTEHRFTSALNNDMVLRGNVKDANITFGVNSPIDLTTKTDIDMQKVCFLPRPNL